MRPYRVKPSPTMRRALELLATGPIRNHGGGYWAPDLAAAEWFTRGTLRALVTRGLAIAHQNHVWRETEYVITGAGLAELTSTPDPRMVDPQTEETENDQSDQR